MTVFKSGCQLTSIWGIHEPSLISLTALSQIYSELVATFDWWDSILFWGILNYCWWNNSRIASWSTPPKMHLNSSSSSISLEAGNGVSEHPPRAFQNYMGVSKNRGVSPKMDGENHAKPYDLMDDLGGKPTIFGNTHITAWVYTYVYNSPLNIIIRSYHHKTKYTDI